MTSPDSGSAGADGLDIPKPDPTPFPDDEAEEIRNKAADIDDWIGAGTAVAGVIMPSAGTFLLVVDEVIQVIKDILGDPLVAWEAATGWAKAAAETMDLRAGLNDKLIVLGSYWEGGAHDAFAGHLTSLLDGMDTTTTKLTFMAKTVANTLDHVLQTYEDALAYIHDYAANLAGLAPLPLSLLDAADLVKGFAEAIFALVEGNLATVNNYLEDILLLQIDAITFPTLAENPESIERIDDTEDWDVRQTA